MNTIDLKKKILEEGYSEKLANFVVSKVRPWNIDEVLQNIRKKSAEKEIIQCCFKEMTEGIFNSEGEFEEYIKEIDLEATQKYLSHCNPDGSFRYEDFLN